MFLSIKRLGGYVEVEILKTSTVLEMISYTCKCGMGDSAVALVCRPFNLLIFGQAKEGILERELTFVADRIR
jgi:hypothetical protein